MGVWSAACRPSPLPVGLSSLICSCWGLLVLVLLDEGADLPEEEARASSCDLTHLRGNERSDRLQQLLLATGAQVAEGGVIEAFITIMVGVDGRSGGMVVVLDLSQRNLTSDLPWARTEQRSP